MGYDVIMADPPWPAKKVVRKVRPNQKAELDYPTMKVSEIKDLPVDTLADDNCVLFLWTTQAFLPRAFEVMEAWGFKYQRVVTWDKSNGMSLYGFHHRTEFLLFGYKGRLEAFPKRPTFPTLVAAKSERHSHKPDIFNELAGKFGDKRIELFARREIEGWTTTGREVDGVDIKEWLKER